MDLLSSEKFKCRVSSVLNKDIQQHGKQFLYDQQDDTAWSSNEGVPQYITIEFEEPQSISGFSFQFQGGFVGKDAKIEMQSLDQKENNGIYEEMFYPDDINAVQDFNIRDKQTQVKTVKFIFKSSTDFFGRIIIYSLRIFK